LNLSSRISYDEKCEEPAMKCLFLFHALLYPTMWHIVGYGV